MLESRDRKWKKVFLSVKACRFCTTCSSLCFQSLLYCSTLFILSECTRRAFCWGQCVIKVVLWILVDRIWLEDLGRQIGDMRSPRMWLQQNCLWISNPIRQMGDRQGDSLFLRSCDSDDMQISDGGQEVKRSYGRNRGKSVLRYTFTRGRYDQEITYFVGSHP